MKMCSRQVAPKTELGGVELNVVGPDAVLPLTRAWSNGPQRRVSSSTARS